MRPTFATLLARGGVGLVQAQRLLGHSDPKLTAQVYTHLDVEDLREAVEALARVPGDRDGRQVRRRQRIRRYCVKMYGGSRHSCVSFPMCDYHAPESQGHNQNLLQHYNVLSGSFKLKENLGTGTL